MHPIKHNAGRRCARMVAALALFLVFGQAQAGEDLYAVTPHSGGLEPIAPIPQPPEADPRKVALGERLFADTRLSRDGSRACITCHDVHTNGAHGTRRDHALDGTELTFNTGTVFNATLSFRLTWEGRLRTLDEEIDAAIQSPDLLGTTMEGVLRRLNADQETVRLFEKIYGHGADRQSLLDAMTTYERSLLTPGSRFDRWLGGDTAALSTQELDGYKLFKKLGCVSCHQGMNVGGNLFERYGIFDSVASSKREMLRVPSLRNVAVTPPYFHDGRVATLDDAVRRMGKAQLNQTLSDQQVDAIVAFLKTLTGNYRGRPLTAPPPTPEPSAVTGAAP
jgi:cytochrome c peroxidase